MRFRKTNAASRALTNLPNPPSDPAFSNDPSGCTAVAALLVAGPPQESSSKAEKVARRIIVANAGDSRSVLCVKGESKAMSHDHKPGNRGEQTMRDSAVVLGR